MDAGELWKRYRDYFCRVDSLDLSLDISRIHFAEVYVILEHLPSNGRAKMARAANTGDTTFTRA